MSVLPEYESLTLTEINNPLLDIANHPQLDTPSVDINIISIVPENEILASTNSTELTTSILTTTNDQVVDSTIITTNAIDNEMLHSTSSDNPKSMKIVQNDENNNNNLVPINDTNSPYSSSSNQVKKQNIENDDDRTSSQSCYGQSSLLLSSSLSLQADQPLILSSSTQLSDWKISSGKTTESRLTMLSSQIIESVQVSVPRKCLVVDDVPTNRKMLRRHLKGHYCEDATDGIIALNMVKAVAAAASSLSSTVDIAELSVDSPARNYDIIFMDYVMPNMNGPTATKKIRDFGYTGPIYGVTGNSLPVDIDAFMNAGATDVIIKPLKKEDLLRMELFKN